MNSRSGQATSSGADNNQGWQVRLWWMQSQRLRLFSSLLRQCLQVALQLSWRRNPAVTLLA